MANEDAGANEETGLSGPDFTQGIEPGDLAESGKLVGHVEGEPVLWCARGPNCSPSGPNARIITRPWSMESWWATRCVVPGIMPASACAPAKPSVRRPSIRSHAGGGAARRQDLRAREAEPAQRRSRRGSRERAEKIVIVGGGAAGLPRPKGCGGSGTRAASSW